MEAEKKFKILENLVEKGYFDINKEIVGVKFNFLRGIAKAKNDYEITKSEKLELFKDYLWIKQNNGYCLGRMNELLFEGFQSKISYDQNLKK